MKICRRFASYKDLQLASLAAARCNFYLRKFGSALKWDLAKLVLNLH